MNTDANAPDADLDLEIDLLLEAIYRKYSYEFRQYARGSIRRRVRVAMTRLGARTVSQLQDAILHDGQAFTALLGHFTVPVTEMFRDPPYFAALRREVVPVLATYSSIKIWVAGCSTGEEVYSLAILLAEAGLLDRTLIYGTDIDPASLRTAADGIYDLDRLPGFTRNYQQAGGTRSLSDYYTAAYGRAALDRTLRARVTFSDHSLATDHVFAEVQLVSCRNVLIYFNSELQNRAIGLFKDALAPLGFLGLGARETLRFSEHASAFQDLARANRIYRRRQ